MTPDPNQMRSGELTWRLDEYLRRLTIVETRTEDVPVIREQIKTLEESMDAVKRALWATAGGLVLLAASVMIAAAQFGGG